MKNNSYDNEIYLTLIKHLVGRTHTKFGLAFLAQSHTPYIDQSPGHFFLISSKISHENLKQLKPEIELAGGFFVFFNESGGLWNSNYSII